eukprot:COSAG06_NODE_23624_length_686_cov_0.868825_2_plen_69_part_01
MRGCLSQVAEILSIATTCIILLIGLGYESINAGAEGGDIDAKDALCEKQPDLPDCTVLFWMNVSVYLIV